MANLTKLSTEQIGRFNNQVETILTRVQEGDLDINEVMTALERTKMSGILRKMIAACEFDWVNEDITQEHFPITEAEANASVEGLIEVHLSKSASMTDVLDYFQKGGLAPANIADHLIWAKTHPDNQRVYPIVSLGSVWVRQNGDRGCPCLGGGAGERVLDLEWVGGAWYGSYRFLARLPAGKAGRK